MRQQIAVVFGFARFETFRAGFEQFCRLAYALERLAPQLAQDGPNPEYPWPRAAPEYAPVTFEFDVWASLTRSGRGRQLLQIIDVAVEQVPSIRLIVRAKTPGTGPFQAPWNFLGLPEELAAPARARAWVLPIPYEGTTSYGAGTRNGPAAIIAASRQVEFFDREFDGEPAAEFGVHTMNPLGPVHRSPEAMVDAIEAPWSPTFSPGSPAPEFLASSAASTRSRPAWSAGSRRPRGRATWSPCRSTPMPTCATSTKARPYSHACAARRILETCPVFQIGIRNISAEEEQFRRQSSRVNTVFAEEAVAGSEFLGELARFVRGKQVFLTIDLDGLDPSIMPAVGTPEPGGLSWARTLDIVRVVCREAARVPVFDVVELAPIPGLLRAGLPGRPTGIQDHVAGPDAAAGVTSRRQRRTIYYSGRRTANGISLVPRRSRLGTKACDWSWRRDDSFRQQGPVRGLRRGRPVHPADFRQARPRAPEEHHGHGLRGPARRAASRGPTRACGSSASGSRRRTWARSWASTCRPGDLLIDLAWNIDCCEILQWCHDHGRAVRQHLGRGLGPLRRRRPTSIPPSGRSTGGT